VARSALRLQRLQRLRFSRPNRGARDLLHQIKTIGAQASRQRRLSTAELRRLIQHWPPADQALNWEVLLLLGQKR
jgi:malonyl-CoA O-methyltransferase